MPYFHMFLKFCLNFYLYFIIFTFSHRFRYFISVMQFFGDWPIMQFFGWLNDHAIFGWLNDHAIFWMTGFTYWNIFFTDAVKQVSCLTIYAALTYPTIEIFSLWREKKLQITWRRIARNQKMCFGVSIAQKSLDK